MNIDENITDIYSKKIILNESGTAYLVIDYLPKYLCEFTNKKFENMWNLHPLKKHKVINTEKEIKVNRYSQSYLQTPKIDKEYTYSGFNDKNNNEDLPYEFIPYYEYIKNIDEKYNQVVVNWYENGDDNISFHSDCTYNMINNQKILIISLYNSNEINNKNLRTLIIKPKSNVKSLKDTFEIKLYHGMIITMCGKIQEEFKHGINKDINVKFPRISLSFRQMKNMNNEIY